MKRERKTVSRVKCKGKTKRDFLGKDESKNKKRMIKEYKSYKKRGKRERELKKKSRQKEKMQNIFLKRKEESENRSVCKTKCVPDLYFVKNLKR